MIQFLIGKVQTHRRLMLLHQRIFKCWLTSWEMWNMEEIWISPFSQLYIHIPNIVIERTFELFWSGWCSTWEGLTAVSDILGSLLDGLRIKSLWKCPGPCGCPLCTSTSPTAVLSVRRRLGKIDLLNRILPGSQFNPPDLSFKESLAISPDLHKVSHLWKLTWAWIQE